MFVYAIDMMIEVHLVLYHITSFSIASFVSFDKSQQESYIPGNSNGEWSLKVRGASGLGDQRRK